MYCVTVSFLNVFVMDFIKQIIINMNILGLLNYKIFITTLIQKNTIPDFKKNVQ